MSEANGNAQPAADVLTDVEVAEVLRCSVEKVRRWRYTVPPRGPRYFRLDRSVRYQKSDVLDFIRRSLVGTKSQPLDTEQSPTSPKPFNRTRKQSGGRRAA